jgi:hypothetical protein
MLGGVPERKRHRQRTITHKPLKIHAENQCVHREYRKYRFLADIRDLLDKILLPQARRGCRHERL